MRNATLLCFSAGGNTFNSWIPRNQRSLQEKREGMEMQNKTQRNLEQTEKKKMKCFQFHRMLLFGIKDTNLSFFRHRIAQIPPDYIVACLYRVPILENKQNQFSTHYIS